MKGWTGWTFNEDLWPDIKKFITKMKTEYKVKKIGINLHPASGVLKHEKCFSDLHSSLKDYFVEKNK